VSEAGVPTNHGTAFRAYVESSGTPGTTGNIQSGIAITNTSSNQSNVSLELFHLDGRAAGFTSQLTIPGNGQTAKFLAELFPTLPQPFNGLLRISTASSVLSVIGIRGRYNERNDFLITTTPPAIETDPPSVRELIFPHLVDGGGYSSAEKKAKSVPAICDSSKPMAAQSVCFKVLEIRNSRL